MGFKKTKPYNQKVRACLRELFSIVDAIHDSELAANDDIAGVMKVSPQSVERWRIRLEYPQAGSQPKSLLDLQTAVQIYKDQVSQKENELAAQSRPAPAPTPLITWDVRNFAKPTIIEPRTSYVENTILNEIATKYRSMDVKFITSAMIHKTLVAHGIRPSGTQKAIRAGISRQLSRLGFKSRQTTGGRVFEL